MLQKWEKEEEKNQFLDEFRDANLVPEVVLFGFEIPET
jgi:hypothetical protein